MTTWFTLMYVLKFLFREKKAKLLDEVMEKETYKVAKQILDKFAPSRLVTPPRPIGQPSLRYVSSFVQSQFLLSPPKPEHNIVDKSCLPCAVAMCIVNCAGLEQPGRS